MNVRSTGHALAAQPDTPCDDAWTVRERSGMVVAALADGVGSAREGGAAAHRAVEMLADYCLTRPQAWSPRRALAEFTLQINRHLHAESLHRYGQAELACTLSAVVLEAGRLYGCNVGDSAVFLWRRGRLERLSEPHTLGDAAFQHVLTRALGLEAGVEPHYFEAALEDGDLLVLCSDGVTGPLSLTALGELLSRQSSARTLVSRARAATEEKPELRDDASAVVIEIIESGPARDLRRQRLEVPGPLGKGEVIDGYCLMRPLADTRRIWLAEGVNRTQVVLKFPPPEAAEIEVVRDAFVREAWNATRLVSPDLVRAWMPETPVLRGYLMEFIDAPTLRAVLDAGRLSVDDGRELALFLLRVAQFLLRHDLAHGDIKPENILVLRGENSIAFRLLDLGSAAELFSVTSRAGTPSYLAPERFRGGAISERTELFAIGVTLYEALTGTYPYGEVERFQTPRFETPPKRLTRLNPAVPAWLESVILRALDPDPERRYHNFSEMDYDVAHPAQVVAHHRKGAPLLERNPLLFYKIACAMLLAVNAWLVGLVLTRR